MEKILLFIEKKNEENQAKNSVMFLAKGNR